MIYTLINILSHSKFDVLATNFYLSDVIVAGEKLQKIYPDLQFGITDQRGTLIWPAQRVNIQ